MQMTDSRMNERSIPMLNTVLMVILIIAVIGALPTWPYSAGWGYFPSGGLVLLVIVLLLLMRGG